MRVLIAACLLVLATTADAAELTLSPESRKVLALAVYGDGYALVWDSRSAPLAAGSNRLAFEGVSRQMLPSSAMIQADHGVQLVDIDYDFALLRRKRCCGVRSARSSASFAPTRPRGRRRSITPRCSASPAARC
jgi:hypothetical protein